MILDPVCDSPFLLLINPIDGTYQLKDSQGHELTKA